MKNQPCYDCERSDNVICDDSEFEIENDQEIIIVRYLSCMRCNVYWQERFTVPLKIIKHEICYEGDEYDWRVLGAGMDQK